MLFLTTNPVTEIFDTLGDIITGAIGIFQSLFADGTGIISIFYATATGLTFMGVLLLLGLGMGLVRFAFGWVKSLIQMRG